MAAILIGTMDLSAGLLSMQAQAYENKVHHILPVCKFKSPKNMCLHLFFPPDYFSCSSLQNIVVASYLLRCKEPVFKASQLSTLAAALLVVAHAIPWALGGCFPQSNSFWAKINRILALFSG